MIGKKVATAHRFVIKNLIDGNIDINRKKCYYPDNLFCTYNNVLFILLFVIGILFHSLYFIIIIDILKIEEIYKSYCGVLVITIIDFILLIYIHINCMICFSIKTIIGHEMGHILGFGHPDKNYYLNWDGYIKNCVVKKK